MTHVAFSAPNGRIRAIPRRRVAAHSLDRVGGLDPQAAARAGDLDGVVSNRTVLILMTPAAEMARAARIPLSLRDILRWSNELKLLTLAYGIGISGRRIQRGSYQTLRVPTVLPWAPG